MDRLKSLGARLLTVLIVGVCTFGAMDNALAWGRKPAWIATQPDDDAFYHGIGVATKKGHEKAAYRDLARHRALRNLAMQISANISSSFVVNTAESSGLTSEEVKSEILAQTEACLEGHELVESYETRKEYWEYYRYSKKQYAANVKQRRDQAVRAAEGFMASAAKAEDDKDVVSALRLYSQSLHELQYYAGDRLPAYTRTHAAIERLLNSISISTDNKRIAALDGSALPAPMTVNATAKYGGQRTPARHLPLTATLGGATEIAEGVTDVDGRALIDIGTVTSAMDGQTVHVRIDIAKLMGREKPDALFSGVAERLAQPETAAALRVYTADNEAAFRWDQAFNGRKVAIYTGYVSDGSTKAWHKMHDELAKIVEGAGGNVVSGTGEIDDAIAWSRRATTKWTHDTGNADVVLIAAATGTFHRRDNKNHAGESVRFEGEIQTASALGGQPDFSDRYRTFGGWNPLGQEMAMEVLALHGCKRWTSSYLKHLGASPE